MIIRRAKATAWILDKVMISIREDELIAGNRTVKPRAGIMSPEMDPYWLLNELDTFPTRPQDRFAISEEDKRIYRETLFPYWEKRSMKDFINGQMTDEVKAAVRTQIFSVNQTDKGQGHIIIDYPRLLNHGLGALVAEINTLCEQQPENPFYQAVLILLEAPGAIFCATPRWPKRWLRAVRTRSVARSWPPSPLFRAITRSIGQRTFPRPASCSGI